MALTSVHVNEAWYKKTYRDVASAISEGSILSPTEHYRRAGYIDGRFPFEPLVDEAWYIETYPDIMRSRAGALQHFQDSGYFEGRIGHKPTIDEIWYCHEYPAAAKSVAVGEYSSCEEHFLNVGYRLGFFPTKPFLP
jgi:hypothetical protein